MNEAMVTREHLAGLELARQRLAPEINDEKLLDEMIAQASAAPEQEPVALIVEDDMGFVSAELTRVPKPGAYPTTLRQGDKLYTHADPSEVERLRAEVERLRLVNGGNLFCAQVMSDLSDDQEEELVLLRQQLSEAQALLRDWLDDKYTCDEMDAKARAFLSATAQPAECETCEPEGVFGEDGSGPFDCYECGKKAAAQMVPKEAESRVALGSKGAAQPAEDQNDE